MEETDDFVRELVRVRLSLRETRKATLKALGHNEDSLKDLEQKTLAQMQDSETIEVDGAIVQKVGKPVWIHKETEYAGYNTYYIHIAPKERGQ